MCSKLLSHEWTLWWQLTGRLTGQLTLWLVNFENCLENGTSSSGNITQCTHKHMQIIVLLHELLSQLLLLIIHMYMYMYCLWACGVLQVESNNREFAHSVILSIHRVVWIQPRVHNPQYNLYYNKIRSLKYYQNSLHLLFCVNSLLNPLCIVIRFMKY